MNYYERYYWGMHLIWWIIWIGLLIWIFFIPYGKPYRKPKGEDALEILRRRYANGDVTKEEYQERKEVLTKKE